MGSTVPPGSITVMVTAVEGSARLWAADRTAMSASLALHDRVMCQVVDAWGGCVVSTAGDGFGVAFDRATRAVKAASRMQARLADADWATGPPLRVGIGLHLGEAGADGAGPGRPAMDTAARIGAVAHGGQVLASGATITAAGIEAADLGEHRLGDVAEPVRLFQVGAGAFPPLRTESLGRRAVSVGRGSTVEESARGRGHPREVEGVPPVSQRGPSSS